MPDQKRAESPARSSLLGNKQFIHDIDSQRGRRDYGPLRPKDPSRQSRSATVTRVPAIR